MVARAEGDADRGADFTKDGAGRACAFTEGDAARGDGFTEGDAGRAAALTDGEADRGAGFTEGDAGRGDGLIEVMDGLVRDFTAVRGNGTTKPDA